MKCILLLFVAISACAASVHTPEGYKEGDRYFYFPKGDDGTPHLIDTNTPADVEFIKKYTENPDNNGYFLYTRSNPTTPQSLKFNDSNSVLTSNFGPKNTVFLAHGWGGNGRDIFNVQLIEAFLQDDDVNVIAFDWSGLASKSYITAKTGTAAVGRELGQFINWLVAIESGARYEAIHLVGISLGGHLVGNAGRKTGSLVRRITGLDPAGPLWRFDDNRITRRDGVYVEIIHTDNIFLGYGGRLGHADFYPNGGTGQPGCPLIATEITEQQCILDNTLACTHIIGELGCSHRRSFVYMLASVKYNNLLANECANITESNNNRCTGSLYPMGNSDILKYREGIFRVNTE